MVSCPESCAPVTHTFFMARNVPSSPKLADRLSNRQLPRPVYAVLGAAIALRDTGPERARSGADRLASEVQELPAEVAVGVRDGVASAKAAATDAVGQVSGALSALRGRTQTGYEDLADRGHDVAVSYATERAVRTRVSRVENRVAPTAGRAAAKAAEWQRRWQESPRRQRAAQAYQRVREASRRGAERYGEMTTPVMVDDVNYPSDS